MKKIFMFLFVLFSMILLASCANTSSGKETTNKVEDHNTSESKFSTPSGEEFTIGILPAESAIPIILAEEKGFFDEAGIQVKITSFTSPNDRNIAVQANELDATIGDVMTEASFMEHGMRMKITSDISEDFKILSSPDSNITEMAELSNKKVSLVPNFLLEYIMDRFAEMDNFSYQIVEIPSFSGRAEALLSNQIDGVVFTEPQASMLVQQGAHLLGSSKDAGIKGGAILFTEDMIANTPGDIKSFYTAYNNAIDYINETDVAEYSNILTDYQFPETMSAYLSNRTYDYDHANAIERSQFDTIIEWTKAKGQISQTYSYEELTDFSFLP